MFQTIMKLYDTHIYCDEKNVCSVYYDATIVSSGLNIHNHVIKFIITVPNIKHIFNPVRTHNSVLSHTKLSLNNSFNDIKLDNIPIAEKTIKLIPILRRVFICPGVLLDKL